MVAARWSGGVCVKTWVKMVLVLGGVGALLTGIVVSNEAREARMTAQAPGTITGVEFEESDEGSSLDETLLEYRFEAGRRSVAGETSRPGNRTRDFAPGQAVKVCYNPQDMRESDIAEGAEARCGD